MNGIELGFGFGLGVSTREQIIAGALAAEASVYDASTGTPTSAGTNKSDPYNGGFVGAGVLRTRPAWLGSRKIVMPLLQPQTTNLNLYSDMSVGSPLPTGWSVSASLGLSADNLGMTDLSNGKRTLTIRFHGTASGSGDGAYISCGSNTDVGTVTTGEQVAFALDTAISNGATAPSSITLRIQERDASGGFLTSASTIITPNATVQTHVGTRTAANASCSRVAGFLYFTVVSGQTYDFTITVSSPQIINLTDEPGPAIRPWVKTSGAAVTQPREYWTSAPVSSGAECTRIALVIPYASYVGITTASNRIYAHGANNRIGAVRGAWDKTFWDCYDSGASLNRLDAVNYLTTGALNAIVQRWNGSGHHGQLNFYTELVDSSITAPIVSVTTTALTLGLNSVDGAPNAWDALLEWPRYLSDAEISIVVRALRADGLAPVA